MAKMKNGLIAFMRDAVIPGPKMLDILVTNTFPMITLTRKTCLLYASGEKEHLYDYEHISIPSDFRLHVTGPKEHIFFNAEPVWNLLENNTKKPLHYFSIAGLPSRIAEDLVKPDETKTWHQAEFIFPFKDAQFNGSTRLFIDFFLHSMPLDIDQINKAPFFMPGLRLANDQRSSILGPYLFESIQRKNKPIRDIAFTIRFGFANIEDNESMYIYTPLDIFQRRPRS